MGHAIGGGFLDAKTRDRALAEGLADAENFAFYNVDRGENPSGSYHGNFRYYDRVFNTEDEAMEFFDSLGSYCDGVVMVREATRGAQNRYNKTVSRINTKKKELIEKAMENFKKRSSESVGCKQCGKRIPATEAIERKLRCPKCGNWLVPESIKNKMERLNDALNLAEEQLKKDTRETGKERYFAKYEVHC